MPCNEFGLALYVLILKISSRTLHVPWDEAGCLCPVGDLFNYAAPGESTTDPLFSEVPSPCSNDTDSNLAAEQLDANSRLTDGGYAEEVAKYCFYAKKHYRKGEQVSTCNLVYMFCG